MDAQALKNPGDWAVDMPPPGVPSQQPLHPGRFLQQRYLKPLRMSQTQAARLLGISRRRTNELVMGHRSMTPDTALRCALAFGLPANVWLALQAEWDCYHAWKALQPTLAAGRGEPLPEAASSGALPERIRTTPDDLQASVERLTGMLALTQRACAPAPGEDAVVPG